jgi:glycosyltransferase involved in cell wall biosynthesis
MISVAMCTYNGSRYLAEQLASIRNQTRLPDELVVCDDRSGDDTVAQLQDFARRSPFPVRLVVNEKNLGSSKNFEKAISLCDGDLIVLTDQDDIWASHRLQTTSEMLARCPQAGLVFGNADIIDSSSALTGRRLWTSENFTKAEQLQVRQGRATEILLRHNVVTGAAMAFRSEFKKLVLPVPDIWVHDGWIALVISFFAEMVALEEVLIEYRQHSNQQIGPSDRRLFGRSGLVRMTERWQFELRARQFEEARLRLHPHAKTERQKDIMEQLCGLIAHMSARSSMPESRIDRISVILRELATRRYSVHSRGVMSAVKDFVA